jgi:predicted O-methyltransferase YrrM
MIPEKYKIYQDLDEFGIFLKLVRAGNVNSYLEIGSNCGGSLWGVASALAQGSRIVSVDLPHAGRHPGSEQALKSCVDELRNRNFDTHLILSDSTGAATIKAVRELSPFGLCFIDGCHKKAFVESDWRNYGPMTTGMVAFHDIGWGDVSRLWNEIKNGYLHIEIVHNIAGKHAAPGIGVLWL